MDWYLKVLKAYAVFSGRARRKEYWMYTLIGVLVAIGLTFVDVVLHLRFGNTGLFSGLYSLAVLVPSIAVVVRRLHDTDRNGWWALIALVPFVGPIVLLVFLVLDGTAGPNRFGPSPKIDDALPPYSIQG
jgi:uncharacterized membrane protein YhaH (DUF805 family)